MVGIDIWFISIIKYFRQFDVFTDTGIVPPIQNWHVDGTLVSDCPNPCLNTKVAIHMLCGSRLILILLDSWNKDYRGAFLPEYDKVWNHTRPNSYHQQMVLPPTINFSPLCGTWWMLGTVAWNWNCTNWYKRSRAFISYFDKKNKSFISYDYLI